MWDNQKTVYLFVYSSKSGGNSSSSLGDVVPSSRKSTPPSSGKGSYVLYYGPLNMPILIYFILFNQEANILVVETINFSKNLLASLTSQQG